MVLCSLCQFPCAWWEEPLVYFPWNHQPIHRQFVTSIVPVGDPHWSGIQDDARHEGGRWRMIFHDISMDPFRGSSPKLWVVFGENAQFFSFRFIDIYWMNKNVHFLNFRSTWWLFWILIGCLQVTRRVCEIDVIEFSEFTSCSISKKHGPNGPNMFSWIWKGLSPVWEKNIKETKFWSCIFRGDFAHNLDKHSVFFLNRIIATG